MLIKVQQKDQEGKRQNNFQHWTPIFLQKMKDKWGEKLLWTEIEKPNTKKK